MEEFSSDDEYCQVEFWNNWWPSTQAVGRISCESSQNETEKPREFVHNFPKKQSSNFVSDYSKFGNWIPPNKFLRSSLNNIKNSNTITYIKQCQKEMETSGASENDDFVKNPQKAEISKKNVSSSHGRSNVESFNWGKKIELHDVTEIKDGDLVWGVVNLGIFSNIKMWVNEYGNICCSAGGEISKLGSSEITYISITNAHLLRKMLNISAAQWASLCESLQEEKIALNFNAFQDFELTGKTTLEKLWFFICKRRHFLPRQCMLVKFCGAVKCLRKFNITPKLLVQDIVNLLGEPIL